MPTDRAAEVCICAAIRTNNGTVIVARRHGDIFKAMVKERIPKEDGEQGFITSIGRFVDRREGYKLQHKAGIKSAAMEGYRGRELYSEDLY
jgi:hypothetical protein